MTEELLGLVAIYGLPVLFVVIVLGCLGLPSPGSLSMLAAGSFVASGDMMLGPVLVTGLAAALLGDQIGYAIGRYGGGMLAARIGADSAKSAKVAQAKGFVKRWGGMGVFLTRWLISPLGPWVNLAGGASGMRWARFTIWDIAGEIVWVVSYVWIGQFFSRSIEALGGFLSNLSGFLAALTVTVLLGWQLIARNRVSRN